MKKKRRALDNGYSDAVKTAEKAGSGNTYYRVPDNMKRFQPEGGKTYRLRFYAYVVGKGNPYVPKGKKHYERTVWVHRNVGPNNDMVPCPAKCNQQACAVCEHLNTLRDATDEERQPFFTSQRQLFIVKDLDNPKAGRQLFETSTFAFGKLLNTRIMMKPGSSWPKFFHPEGGSVLTCTFTKESAGGGSSYAKISSIDFERDKKGYPEDLIEKNPCLDDLVTVPTSKELSKKFKAGATGRPKEDDEEEEESDDEEAGYEDEDEDEYDDEDSDDDDDDDSDDDDDDDEPRRKKKSKKKMKSKKKKRRDDDEEDDD